MLNFFNCRYSGFVYEQAKNIIKRNKNQFDYFIQEYHNAHIYLLNSHSISTLLINTLNAYT